MADHKDGLMDKFPHVPEQLSGLVDLAYNLWWTGTRKHGYSLSRSTSRHGKKASIIR